jgi:hypothetical protein
MHTLSFQQIAKSLHHNMLAHKHAYKSAATKPIAMTAPPTFNPDAAPVKGMVLLEPEPEPGSEPVGAGA